jgi:hypothetical protein
VRLSSLHLNEIETDDVLGVLHPLWLKRPETASRLRGRIGHVLDAARAKGFRQGPNPALWRGQLDKVLPKRPKVARGHHAALPYEKVARFIGEVRRRDAVAALAIEFTVLTAARTGRGGIARAMTSVVPRAWCRLQRQSSGVARGAPVAAQDTATAHQLMSIFGRTAQALGHTQKVNRERLASDAMHLFTPRLVRRSLLNRQAIGMV